LSLAAGAYRAAVHLYPPDFRREFSSEMTRDFRQATHEAWLEGAWRSVLGVWVSVGADFGLTLMVQWFQSRWAAIALIPAAFSFLGMIMASRFLRTRPQLLPVARPDREEIALLLLATVVLLVIAATIIFTQWFTRPLRYRTRR
jgi:hypothetical protein